MEKKPTGFIEFPEGIYIEEPPKEEIGVKMTHRLLGFEKVEGYGVLVHRVGGEYPSKGLIKTDAMLRLNVVKETIKQSFKYPVLFVFSDINKICTSFNDIFYKAMRYDSIKPIYMCKAAITTYKIARIFLLEIGVKEEIAELTAMNIGQMIEGDDAYRYRLQDLSGEVNLENLQKHLFSEINRIISIYEERELEGVYKKMYPMIKKATMLLFIPKYRKAFIKSMIYVKDLCYDNADWYWVRMRHDYLHGGLTYEERTKGLKKPTEFKVEVKYL